MNGRLRDDEVVVGGDARQRYYDSSGYGRPLGGQEIALSRVEAAYLLFKGDIDSVVRDGSASRGESDDEEMGFRAFLADAGGEIVARFLVYADLRDRGFYLSPDREGWVDAPRSNDDFVVYPRGKGPWDDAVLYRIRVVGERADVSAEELGDAVLAVVDEESEITYLETDEADLRGSSGTDHPHGVAADLLDDRVLVWDPPAALHERGFYGQPLDARDGDRNRSGVLQLSLVEAAYLAREGVLSLDAETVRERGREVERGRFDRRLRVYRALRERGIVPKTGFKFGADFRTYADVESVDDLGHSECLVRVLPADHVFSPRDLSLDVRLAHGVRKRMIFALVGPNEQITDWISVSRLTP
ncbi:tRNA-intron lyase [Halorussus aquaticus]|uniref:tRNA-splicing endonuclease n=1 Tax=Halorussus aquaticus TaxID=2953748 RepID=A0ABD5Q3A7_9EURY|nr:tRNA-intron lyase [Halorussus aquaticus]